MTQEICIMDVALIEVVTVHGAGQACEIDDKISKNKASCCVNADFYQETGDFEFRTSQVEHSLIGNTGEIIQLYLNREYIKGLSDLQSHRGTCSGPKILIGVIPAVDYFSASMTAS